MRKSVFFGGKAGQGLDTTSTLFGRILADAGYFVFIYREYSSLIRGGYNFNIITFSDKPVSSHEKHFDAIVALDEAVFQNDLKNLKRNGIIIGDNKIKNKDNLFSIDIDLFSDQNNVPRVLTNNIFVGCLMKYFGVPLPLASRAVSDKFGKDEAIIKKAMRLGFDLIGSGKGSFFRIGNEKQKIIMTGSRAVSEAAIFSGLGAYFYYPMTPATGVAEEIQANRTVKIGQLEDEIAVINAALGASYAGLMAMAGTSGGGLSLMSEAISLAGMAEIPLVVYLAQRAGPATGVPTYTSQGDLKFVLNVGQGEFPRIVIVPGDAREAYYRTMEAFYLAYKYRLVSLLVSDKHLAESHYSFKDIDKHYIVPKNFIMANPPADYKSYQITKSGVTPIVIPGQGPVVRANSYEHDEEGFTTESEKMIVGMNDKRFRKLKAAALEIKKFKPISLYGKGKNLIVSIGSPKGAIIDALSELKNWRFLQISYLEPFPASEVARVLKNSGKIVLIENNATGLLGQIIREKTGIDIKNKILKYNGRPFTAEELIKKLRKYETG